MIDRDSVEDELAVGDRVLVEAEPYGRPVSFRVMILRAGPTELWLGFPSPDRRLELMRPNQLVRLTVARTGAAQVARSEFLRSLGGNKSRVFAVTRPAVLERVQRRDYVRCPMDLPILFRHLDPETWEPRGKVSTSVTKDLSPGGMLFLSGDAVRVGDDLDLVLPLSGLNRVSMGGVVKRLGREARSDYASPNGEPNYAEVGVKFTRITSLDQDRILRLILLTEHRRREAARSEPQFDTTADMGMAEQSK